MHSLSIVKNYALGIDILIIPEKAEVSFFGEKVINREFGKNIKALQELHHEDSA